MTRPIPRVRPLCRRCYRRPALTSVRGKWRVVEHHDVCRQCWRSLMTRRVRGSWRLREESEPRPLATDACKSPGRQRRPAHHGTTFPPSLVPPEQSPRDGAPRGVKDLRDLDNDGSVSVLTKQ